MNQFPICVPTVSFVFMQTTRELESSEVDLLNYDVEFRRKAVRPFVYVVKFVSKHEGGIGVPGGRLKFQSESPLELFHREGGEELGITVDIDPIPFTTRCAVRRDVRKAIAPTKYVHNDPLPTEVSELSGEMFEAHHSVDLVYLGFSNEDPTILVPADSDEVEKVDLLDLRNPLPPLPISDDALLLNTVYHWACGDIRHPPIFLHG